MATSEELAWISIFKEMPRRFKDKLVAGATCFSTLPEPLAALKSSRRSSLGPSPGGAMLCSSLTRPGAYSRASKEDRCPFDVLWPAVTVTAAA
ncbi:hypothetical protein GQ55_3G303100 [Panicum hallii var. hallii]|uniref:Uncharacterized protein n=1 Tax=Panicum hallii var. hallii TaxID=1504633 RepID=A0A2T7EEX6_9POAL|nr:hypothetical protein GQ55_3G303100 [Panicum hallii var. hallii]